MYPYSRETTGEMQDGFGKSIRIERRACVWGDEAYGSGCGDFGGEGGEDGGIAEVAWGGDVGGTSLVASFFQERDSWQRCERVW